MNICDKRIESKSYYYILILSALLLNSNLLAQWKPFNPNPDGKALNSMYFTDDNHGWICGDFGTLLMLDPSTMRWEKVESFTGFHLKSIGFFDNLNGIVCGTSGTLFKTNDGGFTWTAIQNIPATTFNKLQIVGADKAYVVGSGGTILKTTDKGNTWTVLPVFTNNNFTSLFIINDLHWCIGTDNLKIYTTFNAGTSWNLTQIPWEYHSDQSVNVIRFVNDSVGYAFGGTGTLSESFSGSTTDGGVTWSKSVLSTTFQDMCYRDGYTLLAGGCGTWHKTLALKKPTGYNVLIFADEGFDINCCWITPSGHGWAAGAGGNIYYAENFKTGWNPLLAGKFSHIKSVEAGHNLLFVFDYYREWIEEKTSLHRYTNGIYKGSAVLGNYGEYSKPSFSIPGDNVTYFTSTFSDLGVSYDTGRTWQIGGISVNTSGKIYFINDSTGWYYGEKLFKTIDRGANWIEQIIPSGSNILKLIFADNNNGYAIASSKLLKTTNGGADWQSVEIPSAAYTSLALYNKDIVVIAGYQGALYITFNAGGTWSLITSNPSIPENFEEAVFLKNVLFVSAGSSFVDVSTDFGNTWVRNNIGTHALELHSDGVQHILALTTDNAYIYKLPFPVPVEITSFSASQNNNNVKLHWTTSTETNNKAFEVERNYNNTGWIKLGAVAGMGTSTTENKYYFDDNLTKAGKFLYRLKQIDFGGSYNYSNTAEVMYDVPVKYSVNQNYPNPFNPSTTIKYSLPAAGNVKLLIYDALGRKVTTLLDEQKSAGTYDLSWNAEALPSGVYFYEFRSGEYSKIFKMILMK